MAEERSLKRSRDGNNSINQSYSRSGSFEDLQKLRNHHHRFTGKHKGVMNARMQMEQEKEELEVQFQAQKKSKKEMLMLAKGKWATSGEVKLGNRVPRLYQKALGGTPEEAAEYYRNLEPWQKQALDDAGDGKDTPEAQFFGKQYLQEYNEIFDRPANDQISSKGENEIVEISDDEEESHHDAGTSSEAKITIDDLLRCIRSVLALKRSPYSNISQEMYDNVSNVHKNDIKGLIYYGNFSALNSKMETWRDEGNSAEKSYAEKYFSILQEYRNSRR